MSRDSSLAPLPIGLRSHVLHLGLQDDGDDDPVDGHRLAEDYADEVLGRDSWSAHRRPHQAASRDEDAPGRFQAGVDGEGRGLSCALCQRAFYFFRVRAKCLRVFLGGVCHGFTHTHVERLCVKPSREGKDDDGKVGAPCGA